MVEWKKLGEVCAIVRGNRVTKSDLIKDGTYPVISGGVSPLGFIDKFNREAHTITIAQYGSAGYVDIQPNRFWANDVCYSLYPNEGIINLFLYYSLKNKQREIYALRTNAVPAHLPQKDLSNLEIPIPSLSEQSRIVSILDTFISSISNLKQQIEERRKQYEYERDLLLDLEGKEGVEMKTIQDVCKKICSGGTPSTSHKEYYEGNIPWLRTQEIDWKEIYDTEIKITEEAIANSSAKLIAENCVIVAMYGATAAKVAINKMPLSTNQACCNLEIDNNIASFKYVYYWLCKEYQNLKSMGEGSQNNINGQKVKNYPISIPPLSTQSRIVSILDTFEQSISNLEEQLAMREKQYEYYRNQLLTFEGEEERGKT